MTTYTHKHTGALYKLFFFINLSTMHSNALQIHTLRYARSPNSNAKHFTTSKKLNNTHIRTTTNTNTLSTNNAPSYASHKASQYDPLPSPDTTSPHKKSKPLALHTLNNTHRLPPAQTSCSSTPRTACSHTTSRTAHTTPPHAHDAPSPCSTFPHTHA